MSTPQNTPSDTGEQLLFTVTVAFRDDHPSGSVDDDVHDPAETTPGPAEIDEMARAALEAVWFDIWHATDRSFRGGHVVVTVALPDGTLIDDMSK